jgi:hypothetical protein
VAGIWLAVAPEIQRSPERTVALSESREIAPQLEPKASAGGSAPSTSPPVPRPAGPPVGAAMPPPPPAEDAPAAAAAARRRAGPDAASRNAESSVADEARDTFAAAPSPAPIVPDAQRPPPAAPPPPVEKRTATGSAAATARADEPAVPGRAGGGGRAAARAAPPPAGVVAREQAVAVALLARTADGRTLWRGAGNTIERSADGGASWAADYTFDRPITAGSAVSADVAWFVSAGGLVLRRTAGGWSVAQPPAPGVEIAAIEATSATTARVRLADGRQLQTDDAGLSWK